MLIIPKELKYTDTHEWVKIEGDIIRVGITDYAQSELGEVVYVELPDVGIYIEQAGSMGVVESIKSVSEIYAPLSGKVTEINQELARHPQLINKDPYGMGWMVALKIDLKEKNHELDALIGSEDYENKYSFHKE